MSLNKVVLLGRLGNDATVFFTKTYKKLIRYSLATTAYNPNSGENTTDWHSIIFFPNNETDFYEKLSKGDLIVVDGRITYDKDQNGSMKASIFASSIRLVQRKNNQNFNENNDKSYDSKSEPEKQYDLGKLDNQFDEQMRNIFSGESIQEV